MSESQCIRWAVICFAACAVWTILLAPPRAYPIGLVITIPQGASIGEVASILAQHDAVQWPSLFSLLIRIGNGKVVAGPYSLFRPEDALTLSYRFSHGVTKLAAEKVTFPEGVSTREMGDILKRDLQDFDETTFLTLAKPDEGYLFPDTYFFLPGAAPDAVIAQMKETFTARTKEVLPALADFGKPESEVITMASILEKEARQPETRRIVAGILWKRLALGMPLQVDATFGYIFGRDTYSPSGSDLAVDSPYNTYKYRGLPPGPIGNPGIEAIQDAITPIATPYLYYVTDTEGNIYYAKTLDEHIQNIKRAAQK